jgi:hypothetical protein
LILYRSSAIAEGCCGPVWQKLSFGAEIPG